MKNIIFLIDAQKGASAKLHLLHGERYAESFIDKKVKGAIKDVIGRYTYVEVYSTKRESLEQEIEKILPEIVTEAPIVKAHSLTEDYKSVYYDKLVPLIIEAIKELEQEVCKCKCKKGK